MLFVIAVVGMYSNTIVSKCRPSTLSRGYTTKELSQLTSDHDKLQVIQSIVDECQGLLTSNLFSIFCNWKVTLSGKQTSIFNIETAVYYPSASVMVPLFNQFSHYILAKTNQDYLYTVVKHLDPIVLCMKSFKESTMLYRLFDESKRLSTKVIHALLSKGRACLNEIGEVNPGNRLFENRDHSDLVYIVKLYAHYGGNFNVLGWKNYTPLTMLFARNRIHLEDEELIKLVEFLCQLPKRVNFHIKNTFDNRSAYDYIVNRYRGEPLLDTLKKLIN